MNPPKPRTLDPDLQLVRAIGLGSATLLVIGNVLGSAIFLTTTGTYEQLYTYVVFTALLFDVAGGMAVFKLRKTQPDRPRPYRVWGYPFVPAVFVLSTGVLVLSTLIERPMESLLGLGLVALGLPAYWYWSR